MRDLGATTTPALSGAKAKPLVAYPRTITFKGPKKSAKKLKRAQIK